MERTSCFGAKVRTEEAWHFIEELLLSVIIVRDLIGDIYPAELFVNGEMSRGHLKGKEEWSHSHKGISADQDTMIEQGISGTEKTCGEGPICNKESGAMYFYGISAVCTILVFPLGAYSFEVLVGVATEEVCS